MRISRKQEQEIDFLVKFYINGNENTYVKCEARRLGLPETEVNYSPTKDEKEDYISWSVLGGKINTNPLIEAKRKLDIDVKSWRNDISRGLFSIDEYTEDFNHSFATKLFNGILKGVKLEYRKGWTVPELLLANAIRKSELTPPLTEEKE